MMTEGRAKRRRDITKDDIGKPTEFRHVSHVGFDPHKGLDIHCDDSQLKVYFLKAGVSEKHLQDKDTREYVFNFINKNGGIEAIRESIEPTRTKKMVPASPSSISELSDHSKEIGEAGPSGSSTLLKETCKQRFDLPLTLGIDGLENTLILQQQKSRPSSSVDLIISENSSEPERRAKRMCKITKADIGTPTEFRHVSHVGLNPNKGFDIHSDDSQLKAFFLKAGISEKQLQDKDTREYVYNFINKNGGIEAVRESVSVKPTKTKRMVPAPPSSISELPALSKETGEPVPDLAVRGLDRKNSLILQDTEMLRLRSVADLIMSEEAPDEEKRPKLPKCGYNITKADIGKPFDFRHVSHIGFDSQKGFDVDPQLKTFFSTEGDQELHNSRTGQTM